MFSSYIATTFWGRVRNQKGWIKHTRRWGKLLTPIKLQVRHGSIRVTHFISLNPWKNNNEIQLSLSPFLYWKKIRFINFVICLRFQAVKSGSACSYHKNIVIIYENLWSRRPRVWTGYSIFKRQKNPCPGNYILEKFSHKIKIVLRMVLPSFCVLSHTWRKSGPL